jgi:hypothetical protein
MEPWRHTWRNGIAPTLATRHLQALSDALARDDPRLIQGATTLPPPLVCLSGHPCEAACAISYAGWRGGEELDLVGEVEEFFGRVCWECDKLLGEPAACRHFLNWFDDTPRDVVRRELLTEVDRALALRVNNGRDVDRQDFDQGHHRRERCAHRA